MSRSMEPNERLTARGYVTQFVLLFGFWLLLSARFNALFLTMGALSAAGVTAVTHRLVATVVTEPARGVRDWLSRGAWFVVYLGWMLWRILVASVQLTWIVVHPRLPLEQGFYRLRVDLRRPLSRVILANSISLVPGTLTVRVEGDEYVVHALVPTAADDLATAAMQNRIARFCNEAPQDPPEMLWEPIGSNPLGEPS